MSSKPVKIKCPVKKSDLVKLTASQKKSLKAGIKAEVNLTDQKLLSVEIHGLSLPDGAVLKGVDIVPSEFEAEAKEAWRELLSLPSYKDSDDIVLKDAKRLNLDPKWVPGSHLALNYRGNAIKRSKIWFQEKSDAFYRYGYTGWQWKILYATACLPVGGANLPKTRRLVEKMRAGPYGCESNHFIVTKYVDGKDNIGHHSDKTADWVPGSRFKVVKFGAPRRFQISAKEGGKIIFDKILPSGTSVTMDMVSNSATTHSVPVMEDFGLSGSIVSRLI